MKKITLLLVSAFLACGLSMNAQSSCATAQVLTVANDATSTITVAPLSGDPTPFNISCVTLPGSNGVTIDQNGAWFSYTPTQDVFVSIDTFTNGIPDDSNGSFDPDWYYPVLEIFTGICGNLNKSILCDDGWNGVADITFFAKSGVTYYFAFNDLYAQLGQGTTTSFDFQISTNTNVSPTPGPAINPTPADDAVNVPIDESDNNSDGIPDNAVNISWAPPAAWTDGSLAYQVLLSETAPSSVLDMQILGLVSNASAAITNLLPNKEYFWAVRPINDAPGNSPDDNLIAVWSFTTEDNTAGVEDNHLPKISFYPNPVISTLQLEIPASVSLKSVSLHDLSGKQIEVNMDKNNTIDMSGMAVGMYILKLETNKGLLTKKVIKK